MPQYPPPDIPRAATPDETQAFLQTLMSMTQLREAAMAPPAPAPAAPPAPQGLGGLVGLARATGRGIENNQAPAGANVVDIKAGAPAVEKTTRGKYHGEPHPSQAGWWWDESLGRYMRRKPQ